MKNTFIILLIFFAGLSYGQEATTFILVRHAEKVTDGSSDPTLTKEGLERARQILTLFKDANISAIYSTNYKRTKLTVEPLTEAIKSNILIYDPRKLEEFSQLLMKNNEGGTIIISGHSNTTPMLANLLLGEDLLKQFSEDDYGNLLIITTFANKKAKLLHMRF